MGKQIDIHSNLVDRCRSNDVLAQREVYRLYSKAMYHASLRIVGNREDAEDVIQESFVKAFRKMDSFRQESSLGSWLKHIVVNHSLNHIRSRIQFTELTDEKLGMMDTGYEMEEEDEPEYVMADVREAMKSLPEGYRTVFTLYLIEDYSHREIAEMLHISEGTSKSQLNRAKKKLKEELITIDNERRETKRDPARGA